MITTFLLFLLAIDNTTLFETKVLSSTVATVAKFNTQQGVCGTHLVSIEKQSSGFVMLVADKSTEIDTSWTPLFFTKPQTEKKDTPQAFHLLLKSFGIDSTKRMVDVGWKGGPIVEVFGKTSHNEDLPFVSFYRTTQLPAELYTAGKTIRFTDYHKSVIPLAFPGKVLRIDGESTLDICLFIRKEFTQ